MACKSLTFNINIFFPLKHGFRIFYVNKLLVLLCWLCFFWRKSENFEYPDVIYWYQIICKFCFFFLSLDLGFNLKQIFSFSIVPKAILFIFWYCFSNVTILFFKYGLRFYNHQYTGESFIGTHKTFDILWKVRSFFT